MKLVYECLIERVSLLNLMLNFNNAQLSFFTNFSPLSMKTKTFYYYKIRIDQEMDQS